MLAEYNAASDARLQESQELIKQLNQTQQWPFWTGESSERVDIAVSVIGMFRNRKQARKNKMQYLTQTLGYVIKSLQYARLAGFQRSVQLSICNVDPDVESFWEAKELSNVVHVMERFPKLKLPTIQVREKEKQDYIYCMNSSLHYSPSYVLLLEDDALPHLDFFKVLQNVLDHQLEGYYHHGKLYPTKKDVTYVKLYHPEKVLGFFGGEIYHVIELLSVGSLLGTLLTMIFHVLIYKFRTGPALLKLWLLLTIYVFCICMAIGRPHLLELRRYMGSYGYTTHYAPDCCTPAMLFPTKGAKRVITELSKVTCKKNFGKDTALEKFRREYGWLAYLVQPNLVSHIGMYSSVRGGWIDPRIM